MTPKEKAKDLYDKFIDATIAYDSGDHTAEGIKESIMTMVRSAKNCSLIAVDEILELKLIRPQLESVVNGMIQYTNNPKFQYWLDVKEEIKNL